MDFENSAYSRQLFWPMISSFPAMKKIPRTFGVQLKSIREQEGFSQEDLARLTGMDRTFISLMERGLRQPTLTTLSKISVALEIPLSKIITQFGYQNCVTP
jgi:predicted transcriptional regulator